VERTLIEDIHEWEECEAIINQHLYPELERRLAKIKPDLLIARQKSNSSLPISSSPPRNTSGHA
jgi:hypothetical protein